MAEAHAQGPGPDDDPAGMPGVPGGRVAGNALWMMGGESVSKVASIVFVVIVARALGVREYGFFTFATAFVPLLLITGSLGVHQATVRALVADQNSTSELFSSGLALRLITACAAVTATAVLAPVLLGGGLAVLTVTVVGLALSMDAVTSFCSSVFEARGSVRHLATALIINRVGSSLLALLALLSGSGLGMVLAAYTVGSAAGLGYALLALHRQFPEVRLQDARWGTARRLLHDGAPLGLAGLLNMALLRADTLLVAAFLGVTAVGLYGVAFRFYESFLFIAFALGDACFPRYARLGPVPAAARMLEAAATLATAAYVPVFVLSLFAAPWAVVTLFGERYVDAAPAVPWLTLATVLFSLTYQVRNAVVGMGAGTWILTVAAAALAVNVALNLVLIPRQGIVGAALATAVSAAVELALTAYSLHRLGLGVRLGRALSAPVLAGVVTGVVLQLLDADGASAAVGGAALYLVLLPGACLLLPADQRARVLGLINRRA